MEAIRLLQQAGNLIVEADPPRLRIGAVTAPLDPDANMRIAPSGPEAWVRRTISTCRPDGSPAKPGPSSTVRGNGSIPLTLV